MFAKFVNGFQGLVALLAVVTVVLLVTVDPEPAALTPVDDQVGSDVFTASCAGCHNGDRTGGVGPALAGEGALSRFDGLDAVAKFVAAGAPGRMPGFETRLTSDEVAAVAAFVWNGRDQ